MEIRFQCPNLIERTILTLTNSASGLGTFVEVSNIQYYIGGRIVYESSGQEELFENSIFYNSGLGPVTGPTSSPTDINMYTHYWNLLGSNSERTSGFVSGKNSTNFSVKVTFTSVAANVYTLSAVHTVAQVVSISGASGKCSVALSL
jgi:hypothetical protein